MPATPAYDLVVMGGGTGGLVSALVAAGIGARVALVERGRLGGDCLWTGCVPSKSLLAAADLAHRMRHADRVGLTPVSPSIDFSRVMDHVRDAQRIIAPQDSAQRLTREGVEVIAGEARFVSGREVEVDGRRLTFRRAIIATGSSPARPPLPGLDDVAPLTTDTVWELERLPAALAVLGGGPVGCELAQGFARLGARVTLLENAPRLLQSEDERASQLVAAALRDEGVDVRCDARVTAVRDGCLQLDGGEPVAFERLLLATGRVARSAGLGLSAAGVRTDGDSCVVVDGRLRTSSPHIYAVGDVTGAMRFTHVAALHARIATVNALFAGRRTVDYAAVPRVCFTSPEVAQVGLTAAQARASLRGPRIVSFDYAALDRAITDGRTAGFATLVGDSRGRLVGATIAAAGAGESIAELAAWVASGAKLDRVSETVHAYPTLSEGPARAADDHLRARYARPGVRRLAAVALGALRAVDRPR